jgi:hypothetical protein
VLSKPCVLWRNPTREPFEESSNLTRGKN